MKSLETKDKRSLLLICHTYPPVIGGSELEAQRVCQALMKRGHKVTVICAGGSPMPDREDWTDPKGVPVKILARRRSGLVKNATFAAGVAAKLIRGRQDYDFVYFLMQGLHLAVGLPIAWILGKPIIMKIAGSGEILRMRKSVTGRLELHWLKKWAHCVMILNEGMREEALSSGFSPERLCWMPNPVDTEKFAPVTIDHQQALRSKFGIPAEARVVLYCGRLAREKALPSLLDAFAIVHRELPETILVLVGDGPEREMLQTRVRQLEMPDNSVRFTGRVDPDDVPSWLKIGGVFTLVSSSEGFPCALIEAMATGLPSVVSNIPANRQLITDGEQGWLAPVGDSAGIAKLIICLLRSVETAQRMGRAARKTTIENYSTAKIADRYEMVFESIK